MSVLDSKWVVTKWRSGGVCNIKDGQSLRHSPECFSLEPWLGHDTVEKRILSQEVLICLHALFARLLANDIAKN